MEKTREVYLHGILAQKFGAVRRLAVKSPAEAVRALCAIVPGFEAYLMKSHQDKVAYQVLMGEQNLARGELTIPASEEKPFHFVPVLMGSGGRPGAGAFILGAILVVAGYALSVWSGGASLSLVQIGGAMMVSGAITMLTAPPDPGNPNEKDPNKPSFFFDGPVNTTAQGQPVPILFGRMIVGGGVVSAGIVTTEFVG